MSVKLTSASNARFSSYYHVGSKLCNLVALLTAQRGTGSESGRYSWKAVGRSVSNLMYRIMAAADMLCNQIVQNMSECHAIH